MSVYSNNKNRIFIWNALQTFPLFHESFNDPESKEKWFNQIINQFQYQLPPLITTNDLMKINCETIEFIIQKLKTKDIEIVHRNIPSMPPRVENIIVGSELDSRYVQRQKEYELMRTDLSPPEINFKNAEVDEPIRNMDQLIKERDKEFQFNLSLPIKNNPDINLIHIDNNSMLQIPNDVIELVDIHKNKKHVKWASVEQVDTSQKVIDIGVTEKMTILETKIDLSYDILNKILKILEKESLLNPDINRYIDSKVSFLENSFMKKSYL
jgi:hypothetical protein